jgi:hypothetical protein
MAKTPRRRLGRPPHTDDPPIFFGTTIPTSIHRLIVELSEELSRTRSQVIAEAIVAYARRVRTK